MIDWTAAIEIICQDWNRQLRRAPANTKDRTNALVLLIYKYLINDNYNTKTNKYAMYLHIVQNAKAQVETVLDILNLETDGKNDKPL